MKYYWEFGDGSTATGMKTSHTWSEAGDFEVTLWVTDNSGHEDSVTKSISIQ